MKTDLLTARDLRRPSELLTDRDFAPLQALRAWLRRWQMGERK
jgi:hypothetical protein